MAMPLYAPIRHDFAREHAATRGHGGKPSRRHVYSRCYVRGPYSDPANYRLQALPIASSTKAITTTAASTTRAMMISMVVGPFRLISLSTDLEVRRWFFYHHPLLCREDELHGERQEGKSR